MSGKSVFGLERAPLITFGALGRVMDIGPGAVKAAAERAGVESVRLSNGREFISLEGALVIERELVNRRTGT